MGLVKYGKNGFLEVYEKENPYVFLSDFILPKEQIDFITKGIAGGVKSNEQTSKEETDEISRKIVEKLAQAKGKVKGNVYSTGGSATSSSNQNEDMKRRNAKVIYTILNIKDVIILEAIGQKNNAIFLCRDRDDLEDILETFGRRGALENGFYKICHDQNDGSKEKYNVEPVLEILDMVSQDSELFLKTLEQLQRGNRRYPYMSTVSAKFYSLAQAKGDISKEDVFESVKELMGNDKAKGEVVEHE